LEVIPLAPEPIQKQDGSTKNDCERKCGPPIAGENPPGRTLAQTPAKGREGYGGGVLGVGRGAE